MRNPKNQMTTVWRCPIIMKAAAATATATASSNKIKISKVTMERKKVMVDLIPTAVTKPISHKRNKKKKRRKRKSVRTTRRSKEMTTSTGIPILTTLTLDRRQLFQQLMFQRNRASLTSQETSLLKIGIGAFICASYDVLVNRHSLTIDYPV